MGQRSVKEGYPKRTVDVLLRLKAVVQIAQKHRQQEVCLRDICEVIHDHFFFCEFKDPQAVYDRLKVKRGQIDGRA